MMIPLYLVILFSTLELLFNLPISLKSCNYFCSPCDQAALYWFFFFPPSPMSSQFHCIDWSASSSLDELSSLLSGLWFLSFPMPNLATPPLLGLSLKVRYQKKKKVSLAILPWHDTSRLGRCFCMRYQTYKNTWVWPCHKELYLLVPLSRPWDCFLSIISSQAF